MRLLQKSLIFDGQVLLIPLVGMGGLGKTTLAQSIYNDRRIKEGDHSQWGRYWLSDGDENFDAKKLIRKIIGEQGNEKETLDILHNKMIYQLGKQRRFFIVLDDVWHINCTEWKDFWNPLINVGKSGVIIATSRVMDIVNVTGNLHPNYLKPLSDEECWLIFQKCAFGGVSSNEQPILENIGRKIVKMLKGVPLAAEFVGRSLFNETDEREWEKFLNSKEWPMKKDDYDIMPALKWSYHRLPSHLKQCFAYCSIFPKDHRFDREELIRLWMAQGFIHINGHQRPEDVGKGYFKQLQSRSIFQIIDGRCMMHDLIHDLSMSVAADVVIANTDERLSKEPNNIRHISIFRNSTAPPNLFECQRLSTLYYYTFGKRMNFNKHMFVKLECLRVLVLSYCDIKDLPNNIGELKFLRLVDLSGNSNLNRLPESASDLFNLQTLVLPDQTQLPKALEKLVNLRYLEGKIVISKSGILIKQLKYMSPHLSGSISLAGLKSVSTGEEASQAKLKEWNYLDELDLYWDGPEEKGIREAENVAEALHPPCNLKSFGMWSYDIERLPTWMSTGNFSHVVYVKLVDCRKAEFLPSLGEFPQLKNLVLEENEGVKKVGREFYGQAKQVFPELVELKLTGFEGLEEWEAPTGEAFPRLKSLKISKSPKLISLTLALGALERLEIIRCPSLNVFDISSSLSSLEESSSLPLSNLEYLLTDNKLISRHVLESCDLSSVERLRVVPVHSEGQQWNTLTSLKWLSMCGCNEMEWSLPPQLASLTSLTTLGIRDCRQLPSFRADELPRSLESINVCSCRDLEWLPPQLGSLVIKTLCIEFCSTLQSIPGDCLPPSLETVEIRGCKNLESLPPQLASLPLLKKLLLNYCENLQALPDGGLPPSLQTLDIYECPLLERKCRERGGPEWHKIQQSSAEKTIGRERIPSQ